eukprot:NODE_653_length_1540_cov_56.389671_g536_i0.p1 GENE.NODE_653_length_1540_cov_56.389671_g536_i0~~NODE_653_length_1540_cov_56.389671_g536_i0.p1  ORF type:complete len:345 (-),score=82.55 NODE_653_length_1540_cov_56.389671_g536_i0:138-1172(-)
MLKGILENNPLTKPLTAMREKRGLPALKKDTWTTLVAQNIPLVVPINELCFGGKPQDWNEATVLTDFIFLRKGATPPLTPSFVNFIESAKSNYRRLVVMAFSSMPVPRADILEIAVNMVENCKYPVSVIALVGPRDLSKETLKPSLEKKAEELKSSGKILEDKGAPFGELFQHMDCLIVHGGLGTTAEALRVGVPVMVTGVLLMDQRFWGHQVSSLGVGPEPSHITEFNRVCVGHLNKALDPDSPWLNRAREFSRQIQGASEDGVPENLEAFVQLLKTASPVDTSADAVPGQVTAFVKSTYNRGVVAPTKMMGSGVLNVGKATGRAVGTGMSGMVSAVKGVAKR